MNPQSKLLERERRSALVTGITAVAGVAIFAIGLIYLGSAVSGGQDTSAEYLRSIADKHGTVILSRVLQGLGIALLVFPLTYLFRAAAARADRRMRRQLIGVVIAAPLFLGVASVVTGVADLQASDDFKDGGNAKIATCLTNKQEAAARSDKGGSGATGDSGSRGQASSGSGGSQADGGSGQADAKGAAAGGEAKADGKSGRSGGDAKAGGTGPTAKQREDCQNKVGDDARSNASLKPLSVGLGLAGAIGFAVAIVYTALWAMRVGLLTRFWGSLGMALGAVSILFLQFTLLWFIFLGLLIAGWIPGGRPPAWETGEARPWPPPGQPPADGDGDGPDDVDGTGEPVAGQPSGQRPRIERRKRKRRG